LAISHQTKITISNTPTMTKNDGSAATAVQSSVFLPPRINANTPSVHDPAISPLVSLRMRPSARPFPTGRFLPPGRLINKPLLASDVLPEAADTSPLLPQIDIDPKRRGDGGKVSNFFIWFRISIETHLLDY
jgi:hypothetical protein